VLPGVDVAADGQRKQNKLWKPPAIERFRHTDRCPIEGPAPGLHHRREETRCRSRSLSTPLSSTPIEK
jgi:hypothetical protein